MYFRMFFKCVKRVYKNKVINLLLGDGFEWIFGVVIYESLLILVWILECVLFDLKLDIVRFELLYEMFIFLFEVILDFDFVVFFGVFEKIGGCNCKEVLCLVNKLKL